LLRLHIGLAVPLISVALLAMEPTMVAYGGLSGLASGVIALLGLELIRTRHDMPLGAVVLSLLGLKITTDLMLAKPLFVRIDADSIHTSSIAHLAGIAGALVHSGWRAVNGKIFVPCNSTPPLSTHR
jgi:membrane associated rhomboid family serine protease